MNNLFYILITTIIITPVIAIDTNNSTSSTSNLKQDTINQLIQTMEEDEKIHAVNYIDMLINLGDDVIIQLAKQAENEYSSSRSVIYEVVKRTYPGSRLKLLEYIKQMNYENCPLEIELLGSVGTTHDIDLLINLTNATSSETADAALRALGKSGNQRAYDILIKELNNSNSWSRATAAYSLGILGDKRAGTHLAKQINSQNIDLAMESIIALAKLNHTEACPEISKLIKHNDNALRSTAIEALGHLKYKEAYENIASILKSDPDPYARAAAAKYFGYIGDNKAVNLLLNAIDDEMLVTMSAVFALSKLNSQNTIEPLLNKLNNIEFNAYAIEPEWIIAFGKDAINPLINYLNSPNRDMRTLAFLSLKSFGKDAAVHIAEKMKTTNDYRRIMAEFDDRDSVAILVNALKNCDPDCALNIANTLIDINHPHTATFFKSELPDSSTEFKKYAAKILEYVHGEKADIVLSVLLMDENEKVRRASAIALGNYQSDTATNSLIEALNDSSYENRLRAAESLAKIGNPRAITPLFNCLCKGEVNEWCNISNAINTIGIEHLPLKQKAIFDIYNSKIDCSVEIGNDIVPELIEVLNNNKNNNADICALKALAQIKDTRAIESIIKKLGSGHGNLIIEASNTLKQYGPVTIPYLIEEFKSNKNNARNNTWDVFKCYGKPSVKPLINLFGLDENLDYDVKNAIAHIGIPAEEDVRKLLESDNELIKSFAEQLIWNIEWLKKEQK